MPASEVATIDGQQSSGTTSHTCNLPPGIAAGDLLILLFATENGSATTPAGWTVEVASSSNPTTSHKIHVYSKIADSTDVSTAFVTVSTGSAVRSNYIASAFANAQVESNAGPTNGSGSNLTHTAHTDPSKDAIYASWYLFGEGQPSPAVSIWPADYVNTSIESQTDIGLAWGRAPSSASPPASVTVIATAGGPYRGGGMVITEDAPPAPTEDLDAVAFNIGANAITPEGTETLDSQSVAITANELTTVFAPTAQVFITAFPIEAEPTVLNTVNLSIQVRTQFSCIRMIDQFITPVQNTNGPLCLIPPATVNINSFWGVVLREDVDVSFESPDHTSLVDLSKIKLAHKGDMIMFRYDGTGIFIQNKFPIGSGQFTVANEVDTYNLDLTTASIADVGNFIQTLMKELGYIG